MKKYKKLTEKDKKYLLELSRKSLRHIFKHNKEYYPDENEVTEKLRQKQATFVTLTKDGKLRGCIGKLIAVLPLYKDIIKNTYSAAFSDPRFPQLSEAELKEIKIEISILSKPEKLEYKDYNDLLEKLQKSKPGVILEHGLYNGTFLPQVWEEIPDAKDFISRLTKKAGLNDDIWKERPKIFTYKVVKFRE